MSVSGPCVFVDTTVLLYSEDQADPSRQRRALAWLRDYDLGALPPEGERLLKLMLALAEVAPAVEWYNDPRVFDGFPVERIRYLRQISDTAAQG